MGQHRALRGGGVVDDSAFCQPDAYINGTASVGARSYLGHGVYVNAGVTIGTDCIICDRVRVIANVPNGTTIACDCCNGGGGGGGTVVPVISVDSVYTVGVRLSNIVTTGMVKGTLAYVGNDTFVGQGSVHRYYTLVYSENNATSATDLEVVNSPTFGVDGAQWVSLDTVNQQALLKRFWAIDETAGNDENDGWGATQVAADAVPLKTMDELNRRLFGANFGNGVTVFHQLTNITTGRILSNVKTSGSGYVLWLGTKTIVFSGAVTAFAAENPAGPSATSLTIASLPVGWVASGLIGNLIESADGLRVAFPTAETSAKVARITTPCNSSSVTKSIAAAASVFTVAETVNVCTLTQLPVWPFTGDCQTAGVQYTRLTIGAGSVGRNGIHGTSCFITRSQLATEFRGNASIDGIRVSGCLIDVTAFSLIFSGGMWFTSFIGLLSTAAGHSLSLNGQAQWLLNHGGILLENANIVLGGQSSFSTFAADAHVAAFNVTNGAVLSSADASSIGRIVRCNSGSFLYGTGNTVQAAGVAGGATMTLPPAAQCVFGTTVLPLSVAGILYNFFDMPIVDANTLAGING